MLAALVALVSLAACGGEAVSAAPTEVTLEAAPAVLVGGFIDPAADWPSSNDLTITDGASTYLVMFRDHRSGEEVVARINDYTSATITASLDDRGHLVLTTVEHGPDAEITVLRGAALDKLGLVKGESARGQ